jgi:hypothetical protein
MKEEERMTPGESVPNAPKTVPRQSDSRGAPEADERGNAVKDLPPTLRKLLEETPRKQWYRVKAVLADTWETVELLSAIHAVRHLMRVAPEKMLARILAGEIEVKQFESAFRGIRERITALRDGCQELADLARVELKTWAERTEPGQAPELPAPPAIPFPGKSKAAG